MGLTEEQKAEVLREGESEKFILSQELGNKLAATPGEEFFFNSQMTLREVLDRMLSVLNYRVTVTDIDSNGNLVLGYRDLNRQSDDIKELGPVDNEAESQDMEYLAQGYETVVRNALSKDRRVMTEEWQTLKPASLGVVDSEGFRLVVSNPIEELTKVMIRWQASCQDTDYNEYFFTVDWDITDLFVEQEIYDAMPLTEQEKHAPYTRGTKEIGVLGTYKKLFFSFSKLRSYLIEHAYSYIVDYIKTNYGSNVSALEPMMFPFSIGETSLYQVSYVPYLDLHYSQTKENADLSVKSAMISNQQDEAVEIERYANSLRTLANKLGNKVYEADKTYRGASVNEALEQLLELGDRIAGDYTLISREYAVYDAIDKFVKCHYVFIQHFSNVLTARLSRERRLYRIPIENIIDRDVLLKDYLILSLTKDLKGDGILDESVVLPRFLKTFNNASDDEDTPIERLKFNTNAVTGNVFSLPLRGTAVGKIMHWQTKCYDNFSVGLSTGSQTIGGKVVYQNPYVDENGEFETLYFQLIKSRMDSLSFENQLQIGQALPRLPFQIHVVYAKVDFTGGVKNIKIFKDRFERFGFCYQLEPIARKADADKIIIGDSFAKYANLLFGKNETPLYVWASQTESYRPSETKRCKGTKTPYRAAINSTNYSLTANVVPQSQLKSWAIGDEEGNLILAVNNNFDSASVYFTISRNVI